MKIIDIDFDYREDSKCGDPDADSPLLYEMHKELWNKPLPSEQHFGIELYKVSSSRILLSNKVCDNLSSDRMCPHFNEHKNGKFDNWLPKAEINLLKHKVRTIGGHIVFPAHKKDGHTINQARGVNAKIGDRFDLTLECISRFYNNEDSPLASTLRRYSEFLNLFVNFKGYIDFFLLSDFVDDNNQVVFVIPFDEFSRSPWPTSIEEYQRYKNLTIDIINRRNNRILDILKSN